MAPQQQMGMPPPTPGGMTMVTLDSMPPGVGGQTVDDAFAGLSNDAVDPDEYSIIGPSPTLTGMDGPAEGQGGYGGGMVGGVEEATVVESVANPPSVAAQSMFGNGYGNNLVGQEPEMTAAASGGPMASPPPVQRANVVETPQPANVAPGVHPSGLPSPPLQKAASFRSPPIHPAASGEASAQLAELQAAHQKMQAELISLRAKAASVTDEEREAQDQVAALASEIAGLSEELGELKDELMSKRERLTEALGVLKSQTEKKE